MATRITKVSLRNVCNIRELDLDLSAGIIGVLGPNGSGKSTLLNSVYAALTNDFGWHCDGKAGVPTMGIGGQESSIALELATDAGPVSIRRKLAPTVESCLEHAGRKTTGAQEISRIVQSVLGASGSVIRNFIFVEQWQLFSFLTAPAAVRIEFLSAICDTDRLESLWRQAGELLSEDSSRDKTAVVEGRLSGIEKTIKDVRAARRENASALKELVERMRSKEDLAALREIGARQRRAQAAVAELSRVRSLVADREKRRAKLELALADAEKRLKDSERDQNRVERLVQSLDAEKSNLAQTAMATIERRNAERTLDGARQRLSENESRLSQLREAMRKAHGRILSADRLSTLTDRIAELRLLSEMRKEGVSKCPVCRTDFTPSEELKNLTDQEIAAAINSETAVLSRHQDSLSAITANGAVEASLVSVQDGFRRMVSESEKALETMAAGDDEAKARWDKARTSHLAAVAELEQTAGRTSVMRTAVSNISRDLAAVRTEIEVHSLRGDELSGEAALMPSPEEAGRAEEILAAQTTLRTDARSLKAVIAAQDKMLEEAERDRLQAVAEIREMEPLRKWIDRLHGIRGQFHRDALPRRATAAVLSRLVEQVNRTLSRFGAPFTTELAEQDMQFMGRFSSGLVGPRSLSGAQKVMLALAIRLSVGFGFLALDEPTAGLDQQTLSHIIQSIHQMRDRIRNAGGQVIIVTHEPALLRVFDQVVRL